MAAQAFTPGIELKAYLDALQKSINNPLSIEFNQHTIGFVLSAAALFGLGVAAYYVSLGKRRPGEEHGSAIWATPARLRAMFAERRLENNIILTQNVRMGLNSYKHGRNLNVLCVGGSGSGKSRYFALPNLLNCNTSFIVTDVKSELLSSTGNMFLAKGYKLRVFDLINPERSDIYNPFYYLHDEKDVLKLCTNIIRNTTPKTAMPSDPFWEKAETALLQALLFYLLHEAPEEEQNFGFIMTMLEHAEVREENSAHVSPLDLLFDSLAKVDPSHIAVRQYRVFKQATGKTASSIIVSLAVRLSAFNLEQIRGITSGKDGLEIGSLGEEKTALFLCIPDNDTSLNYLVGMLYTQAFQTLFYKADREYGGRLPVPVHFVLDEAGNTMVEEMDKICSVVRSRNISISFIYQNLAQIKAQFEKSWETIPGNADSLLFLGGGNELTTLEFISKMLGKSTIDMRTHGLSKGRSGNYSTNYQISGRELLQPDEIRKMDKKNALVFVSGAPPVMDKKYDLMRHPNIKLTAHGGAKPYTHKSFASVFTLEDWPVDLNRLSDYSIIESEESA